MKTCPKCTSTNSDARRYCRECGSALVQDCRRCGFGNSFTDKYCGGCGINLSDPVEKTIQQSGYNPSSVRYSYEDITDLMQGKNKEPDTKGKNLKGTDSVSQDMLDSIFEDSED